MPEGEMRERLARIEECQETIRREIHAIFDLHNHHVNIHNDHIAPTLGRVISMEKYIEDNKKEIKEHQKSHWVAYSVMAVIITVAGALFTFGQKIARGIGGS